MFEVRISTLMFKIFICIWVWNLNFQIFICMYVYIMVGTLIITIFIFCVYNVMWVFLRAYVKGEFRNYFLVWLYILQKKIPHGITL